MVTLMVVAVVVPTVATVPPKDTVEPAPKFTPVMVTVSPGAADEGKIELMLGIGTAAVTVNDWADVAAGGLAVVTETTPVPVVVDATVADREVPVALMPLAATPFMVTPLTEHRLVPVTVTTVPGAPESGAIEEIVGAPVHAVATPRHAPGIVTVVPDALTVEVQVPVQVVDALVLALVTVMFCAAAPKLRPSSEKTQIKIVDKFRLILNMGRSS